jgi:small conductance mechanosensitive channel
MPDLKMSVFQGTTGGIIVGILIASYGASLFFKWILNRYFEYASRRLKVDPTRYKFFRHIISLFIYFLGLIALVYTVPELRNLALTMFASAGVFLAIIGFAGQQGFSNIISGIFIVIFRPFRVGDVINVGTLQVGEVEDITLRHTVIIDLENRRIIIPNSVISSETVINSSIDDARICEFVEIGISYGSDLDLAIQIVRDEAENHKLSIDNRTKDDVEAGAEIIKVNVIGFGDFSVNLRAYVWCDGPVEARQLHYDLNKSIKLRFDREGIEIPFPYRTMCTKRI